MKVQIFRGITPEQAYQHLPAPIRARFDPTLVEHQVCTLVVFPAARRVVRSPVVRKALSALEGGQPLLVVGTNFTLEARAVLAERGAVVAAADDFAWTDDGWPQRRSS